ncbi:uncharacterized protein LOC134536064 isoform X2 [Bacillus rossius redtenbacheri]
MLLAVHSATMALHLKQQVSSQDQRGGLRQSSGPIPSEYAVALQNLEHIQGNGAGTFLKPFIKGVFEAIPLQHTDNRQGSDSKRTSESGQESSASVFNRNALLLFSGFAPEHGNETNATLAQKRSEFGTYGAVTAVFSESAQNHSSEMNSSLAQRSSKFNVHGAMLLLFWEKSEGRGNGTKLSKTEEGEEISHQDPEYHLGSTGKKFTSDPKPPLYDCHWVLSLFNTEFPRDNSTESNIPYWPSVLEYSGHETITLKNLNSNNETENGHNLPLPNNNSTYYPIPLLDSDYSPADSTEVKMFSQPSVLEYSGHETKVLKNHNGSNETVNGPNLPSSNSNNVYDPISLQHSDYSSEDSTEIKMFSQPNVLEYSGHETKVLKNHNGSNETVNGPNLPYSNNNNIYDPISLQHSDNSQDDSTELNMPNESMSASMEAMEILPQTLEYLSKNNDNNKLLRNTKPSKRNCCESTLLPNSKYSQWCGTGTILKFEPSLPNCCGYEKFPITYTKSPEWLDDVYNEKHGTIQFNCGGNENIPSQYGEYHEELDPSNKVQFWPKFSTYSSYESVPLPYQKYFPGHDTGTYIPLESTTLYDDYENIASQFFGHHLYPNMRNILLLGQEQPKCSGWETLQFLCPEYIHGNLFGINLPLTCESSSNIAFNDNCLQYTKYPKWNSYLSTVLFWPIMVIYGGCMKIPLQYSEYFYWPSNEDNVFLETM